MYGILFHRAPSNHPTVAIKHTIHGADGNRCSWSILLTKGISQTAWKKILLRKKWSRITTFNFTIHSCYFKHMVCNAFTRCWIPMMGKLFWHSKVDDQDESYCNHLPSSMLCEHWSSAAGRRKVWAKRPLDLQNQGTNARFTVSPCRVPSIS